jgi:hypothetical protein
MGGKDANLHQDGCRSCHRPRGYLPWIFGPRYGKISKCCTLRHTRHQFLWKELEKTNNPQELLQRPVLRAGLVSTAGVSAKTAQYLTNEEIDRIVTGIINAIGNDRLPNFREEVFCRYLLTRGASLDGAMRNFVGAVAGAVLVAALLKALQDKHDPTVYFAKKKAGVKLPAAVQLVGTKKVQRIEWSNRCLLFDKKPRMIGKSVDLILLDSEKLLVGPKVLMERADHYLACGELKGGIDPAGADEHWKTARAALDRINEKFVSHAKKPAIFLVGAAIQTAMASEIFARLQDGRLTHAANLTVPEQVADLASWLVSL